MTLFSPLLVGILVSLVAVYLLCYTFLLIYQIIRVALDINIPFYSYICTGVLLDDFVPCFRKYRYDNWSSSNYRYSATFCQLWGEAHFLVHLWHLGSCYRRDTMLQKLT